ncbi:NAD(P)-binding protein [Aquisalimonas asiatica]|uniref:Trk K+ transport system, NAD-binding component n=1 Tax=Aquisalimonas asiatica TaxID=406100 RepID=A0A1H8VEY2_9GAMM|nr:NAD(P)-binding protein [Aquisalimonas asiatica]SEP13979.1 Trk K+ transport system, NAD-binding component [Aquisalimonas asiatica]
MVRSVVPLILRRMRPPLLVLITAYAVAVVGLTLMPGQDDQGAPWRMDFFHAFYVITYTAPTIGFGEIPYEFSGAQRLWVTISIYITVLAWLYAVGTIISLIQDPAFRSAVKRGRLRRAVRQMSEPFYLVCGYGDTGALLVRALTERRRRVVVVDHAQDAIESLELRDLGVDVPGFRMNAEIPENLTTAGLDHRWCAGVVAVMDDDHANLKVAVASKLQSPSTTVIARAGSSETAANMASFGTDAVVDAYSGFAERLILAIRSPDMHRIQDWLTGIPATELPDRPQPPEGPWLICGFGRLGRAVYHALRRHGVRAVIVDDAPKSNGCPPDAIRGKGTEAHTLRRAGIESAAGLLAATADDADNLSIVITARQLNSSLYIAARENALSNKPLFREADIDLTVEPSYILASRILSRLNAPLLEDFLEQARARDTQWHAALADRIQAIAGGTVPETWTLRISAARCPAVIEALEQGMDVTLAGLTHHPRDRHTALDCIPLLLLREDESVLLPSPETTLASGDRILFCGTNTALGAMRTPLRHINNLRYMLTGESRGDGLVWRYLARRSAR